jgi:hypothetical protein
MHVSKFLWRVLAVKRIISRPGSIASGRGGGVGTQRGGHAHCCSKCVGRRRCTGRITSGVGVLRVVLEVLFFYPLLLVQGFGQTCVEEFQQVQIACTPFESGVLQMAWGF